MPDVLTGADKRATAERKAAEYRAKYGEKNVALRFIQLPR